jgi:hypothetical protein
MARPLRIEFAGALYHITARGNDRKAIYLDDVDRKFVSEGKEGLPSPWVSLKNQIYLGDDAFVGGMQGI